MSTQENTPANHSLENCKPSKSVEAKSRQQNIVKRSSGDELIRISDHHIELACDEESGGATNSLESTFLKLFGETCKPNPELENARRQKDVLRSNSGTNAFIITKHRIDVMCISEPRKSYSGDFQGEVFYGVSTEMQPLCADRCRSIRFHGCVSETGGYFLLIEKLSTGNSWNLSKQEAIEQGSKAPIILRSNSELRVYEVEAVETEIVDTLDAAAFDALCEQAFKGMIIDSPDHRLLKTSSSADIWEV